jgi:hypothetical protein
MRELELSACAACVLYARDVLSQKKWAVGLGLVLDVYGVTKFILKQD